VWNLVPILPKFCDSRKNNTIKDESTKKYPQSWPMSVHVSTEWMVLPQRPLGDWRHQKFWILDVPSQTHLVQHRCTSQNSQEITPQNHHSLPNISWVQSANYSTISYVIVLQKLPVKTSTSILSSLSTGTTFSWGANQNMTFSPKWKFSGRFMKNQQKHLQWLHHGNYNDRTTAITRAQSLVRIMCE